MHDSLSPQATRPFRIALALSALVMFAGCASGPYVTALMIQGTAKLNPTFDQKPSAVNIRIIPLIDKEAFANARDEDLLANPPNLPAGTWIPPHTEAIVYVAQKGLVDIEIKPKVRFLGIFGIFNDEDGPYRQLIGIDAIDESKLVFDKYTFEVRPREEGDSE